MAKVAIIGAGGLLGQDLVKDGKRRGWQLSTPTRTEVDVRSPESVVTFFSAERPTWAINCAAYVAVDDAETESDEAYALNADAAENVARACSDQDIRLLHMSTDYVFGGDSATPYREDYATNPLGVYAASKLEGEKRVLANAPDSIVARTAWLYGTGRDNFPLMILRKAIAGKSLRLVSDRVGSPTYTRDLAVAIADIVDKSISGGIYHVVNEGVASWYDLCKEMIEFCGLNVEVQPANNNEYPTPAARPMYSVLSTEKLLLAGIAPLPHWKVAVRRFVDELRDSGVIVI